MARKDPHNLAELESRLATLDFACTYFPGRNCRLEYTRQDGKPGTIRILKPKGKGLRYRSIVIRGQSGTPLLSPIFGFQELVEYLKREAPVQHSASVSRPELPKPFREQVGRESVLFLSGYDRPAEPTTQRTFAVSLRKMFPDCRYQVKPRNFEVFTDPPIRGTIFPGKLRYRVEGYVDTLDYFELFDYFRSLIEEDLASEAQNRHVVVLYPDAICVWAKGVSSGHTTIPSVGGDVTICMSGASPRAKLVGVRFQHPKQHLSYLTRMFGSRWPVKALVNLYWWKSAYLTQDDVTALLGFLEGVDLSEYLQEPARLHVDRTETTLQYSLSVPQTDISAVTLTTHDPKAHPKYARDAYRLLTGQEAPPDLDSLMVLGPGWLID